jgi:hypothetical protein
LPGKGFWIAFGIGVAAVAVIVAGTLYMQRGAHIELTGSVLKVRTAAMDEYSSVAVVDFRFTNPADYAFVVRKVEVSILGADGNTYPGFPVSETDVNRLFEYYKTLGQKFNDSLMAREKIKPRSTEDRMIVVRFEAPERIIESRKQLTVRIEDVDGPVSELVAKQ